MFKQGRHAVRWNGEFPQLGIDKCVIYIYNCGERVAIFDDFIRSAPATEIAPRFYELKVYCYGVAKVYLSLENGFFPEQDRIKVALCHKHNAKAGMVQA
jgi:hypothetical protein